VKQVVIENPILNSPFEEPCRHFRFGEEGITNEIISSRRSSVDIRSSSTDDIACWFVDTDYNGESFFVRHAFFAGADEPYEKLKRALRAEIDEAGWSSLYSTRSQPFEPPKTGKVAVKVINHYGDEVMKVFDVRAAK
jgi:hypothetical protein